VFLYAHKVGSQRLRVKPRSVLRFKLTATALAAGLLGLCTASSAAPSPAPQWQTLATDAYPKKRDDLVFIDAQTAFYGTGKGNLYRTVVNGAHGFLAILAPV
jgi:hypothetical protein